MKKIKLLISLTALPLLGASLVPISSCNKGSEPEAQYTVTFDTQGGSTIDPVKVDKGSKVTKPTDPTKQGNEFKGWFTDKECTKQFDFNTPITSNVTLYAKWEQQEILVTSVTITNTTKEVKEGEELELTATVKPDNATNKQLNWTVTSKTGTASIIEKNNKVYLKGSTAGTVSVKAKAKDTGGVESAAVEFEVKSSFVPKEFSKTDLSVIISAINTFEASKQDESAMKALCYTFLDTDYIENIPSEITDPNRKIEAHLGNFIGKTVSIKINNQDHVVRVIGINHDLLKDETEKYAAFTFELVTLLSDSNGDKMTSILDQSPANDYTNSVLRANLTGGGNGTKTFSSTVLSLLPIELTASNAIKTVKKSATIKNSTIVTTYNDKLFPLSYTEMAQSGAYAEIEGTAYTYWTNNNSASARIKKDINGTADKYWLCSLYTGDEEFGWFVDDKGEFQNNNAGFEWSVSFGFCI